MKRLLARRFKRAAATTPGRALELARSREGRSVSNHVPAGVALSLLAAVLFALQLAYPRPVEAASDPVELVTRQLQTLNPRPAVIHLSPSVERDQIVNLRSWLWVDPIPPLTTQAVSPPEESPPVRIDLQAVPQAVVWDMGDGHSVTCVGPGRAYNTRKSEAEQQTDCAYTYTKTSAGQPHDRFTVKAAVVWQVSVTSAEGVSSGDLDRIATVLQGAKLLGAGPSSVSVRVAERQGVNGDAGTSSTGSNGAPGVYDAGQPPPGSEVPSDHAPSETPEGKKDGGGGRFGFLGDLANAGKSVGSDIAHGAGKVWNAGKSVAGDIAHGAAGVWDAGKSLAGGAWNGVTKAWDVTAHCFGGPNHTCLKWAGTIAAGVAVTVAVGAVCATGVGCVVLALAAGGLAAGATQGGLFCSGGSLAGCIGKGALAGGVAGLAFGAAYVLAPAWAAVLAGGAAAGFFGTAADQVMNGHLDPGQLAINTALGAVFAFGLSKIRIPSRFSKANTEPAVPPAVPKGGAYKNVPANGGHVHHMPADSVSPLSTRNGPGIRMSVEDHMKTASYGRRKAAQAYRAEQKALIDRGKFHEALQKDIDNIRDLFGNKYDGAIMEMLEYTRSPEFQRLLDDATRQSVDSHP